MGGNVKLIIHEVMCVQFIVNRFKLLLFVANPGKLKYAVFRRIQTFLFDHFHSIV